MDQSTEAPDFMTTREVAALLRVKERKVYEMAAEGEIPCRRVTGKLLFPRGELEAWLSGDAGPSSAATKPLPNVVTGSHDPLLDWAIRESGSRLATLFDGSLDGLERVGAGEAVAAGMHVFEPESGDWNTGHVAATMPNSPVVLIEWARRQQGLILAPGLEGEVREVADLRGRRIVQRQAKAGAGLLLKHLMQDSGLGDGDVTLLPDLARTETEAAATVASGKADAAPGLLAMAQQFGLPFAPTVVERFDLLIDRRSWFEPPLQSLFAFARTAGFRAKAAELGGYDVAETGRVHWNGGR